MRAKPKGKKYRNLYARGAVIHYESNQKGRRIRFSTKTDSWSEAAAVRDLYEQELGSGGFKSADEVPRFDDFAARYLDKRTRHLAPTTRQDREGLLDPSGRIVRYFGALPLDRIDKRTLVGWWDAEVEGRGRSRATGANYLDALSGVFGFACDVDLIDRNPCDEFRAMLRRRNRTKSGRADAQSKAYALDEHEIAALLDAIRMEGPEAYLVVLLLLDTGMRVGEAEGLRWQDVDWGREDDLSRSVMVEETIARGKWVGVPKSGRTRRVDMSKRLRAALREHYIAQGQPTGRVLSGFNRRNFHGRHFRRACDRAGLHGDALRRRQIECDEMGAGRKYPGRAEPDRSRSPKDLRDTFASWLLTRTGDLGYVSTQLGHADVGVTSRHYARWMPSARRAQLRPLAADELPPDLMADAGAAPPPRRPSRATSHRTTAV